jgi:predicted nucleic acid-binding protein
LKKDRAQRNRELFLDTTYILPFFQVPITVEGFELSDFKILIANLSKVHVSELSIYEAKAKLTRLSKARRGYEQALRVFGRNLNVLRLDEKFVFHSYTSEADERFNQLLASAKRLDAFDLLILSEAFTVGELLTEDEDLLTFRDSDQFAKSPLSKSIRIRCWKEIDRSL